MLTNFVSFYTWEMSQRLNPQSYAGTALVFVELKCESTNSEGGSSLAQYLSKLEGGKRQCSHSMLLCSVYFSERKKIMFHTFARQQIEKKLFHISLSYRVSKSIQSWSQFIIFISKQKLSTNWTYLLCISLWK